MYQILLSLYNHSTLTQFEKHLWHLLLNHIFQIQYKLYTIFLFLLPSLHYLKTYTYNQLQEQHPTRFYIKIHLPSVLPRTLRNTICSCKALLEEADTLVHTRL